ncbi:MAG: phosphate ABC transporter permease subunit PstC [Planctomycetes bacterium]|nr:phosphate ABC transporter permease subunit PstC [Planctomycetota bacterium]MCB9887137.1 phosphate ABC transporter permease subunit PstC [Planctomycetota bacterium]
MSTPSASLAQPPTAGERWMDLGLRRGAQALAVGVLVLLAAIVVEIGAVAAPAVRERGVDFLTSSTWDTNRDEFGILPHIWGTLYSSLLALLIGGTLGLAVAVFISQRFLPRRLELLLKNVVDLLAAIPSVVYGLWGIFFVIPAIRPFTAFLHEHLGFVPLFDERSPGPNMLASSLVLAIMVLPTMTAVSRDAIATVPRKLREAAFGLGATRWECILGVVLPTAATGVFGALVLAFGRALGETMALAMLLGNRNEFNVSLLAPGNTLAALIANTFPEAQDHERGVLMYAAIVLLSITLVVNMLGTAILVRSSRKAAGARP